MALVLVLPEGEKKMDVGPPAPHVGRIRTLEDLTKMQTELLHEYQIDKPWFKAKVVVKYREERYKETINFKFDDGSLPERDAEGVARIKTTPVQLKNAEKEILKRYRPVDKPRPQGFKIIFYYEQCHDIYVVHRDKVGSRGSICFEVSDFVCFFTFFITAIVALLFVQYFFVYLSTESDDKVKTFLFMRCFYFFLLTFLGCLVFAGVQRRSIFLLKWPSRLLTTLLTIGLVTLTGFLWTLDRVHKQFVPDLEGKTVKLCIVIALLLIYYAGVHKLILQIQNPLQPQFNSNGSSLNVNQIFSQSSQANHPNLVEIFRSSKDGGGAHPSKNAERQINVASNGVNYYQLLLEGSLEPKPRRFSSSYSIGSICDV